MPVSSRDKPSGSAVNILPMQFNTHFLHFLFSLWRLRVTLAMAAALGLVACSPSLNWRQVQNADAHYTVLLPAKPASHSRPVVLGEMKVEMQMTAAEADDMNFAVASAIIEEAAQRKNALAMMQQAMVKNIGGSITGQKKLTLKDGTEATEIHASGTLANGRRMVLFARFAIKEQRVYQAVVIGPQERLSAEVAETFLTSFTLQ